MVKHKSLKVIREILNWLCFLAIIVGVGHLDVYPVYHILSTIDSGGIIDILTNIIVAILNAIIIVYGFILSCNHTRETFNTWDIWT